jgi:hypothetical protein
VKNSLPRGEAAREAVDIHTGPGTPGDLLNLQRFSQKPFRREENGPVWKITGTIGRRANTPSLGYLPLDNLPDLPISGPGESPGRRNRLWHGELPRSGPMRSRAGWWACPAEDPFHAVDTIPGRLVKDPFPDVHRPIEKSGPAWPFLP